MFLVKLYFLVQDAMSRGGSAWQETQVAKAQSYLADMQEKRKKFKEQTGQYSKHDTEAVSIARADLRREKMVLAEVKKKEAKNKQGQKRK